MHKLLARLVVLPTWVQNGPGGRYIYGGGSGGLQPGIGRMLPRPIAPQPTPHPPSGGAIGGGTGPSFGGVANVQTSVTPQAIFTPDMTTASVNQAVAQAHKIGNPHWLMKQFDRPGISRSPGQASLMMPQLADAYGQATLAREQIPFSDAAANAQNILRGQVAREDEALGLAGVLNKFKSANQAFDISQNNALMQLLTALLGNALG